MFWFSNSTKSKFTEKRSDSFLNSEIGLATARAGNVIGGGDWANDRLVPDFFRAVGCGEVVEIRNPKATRPWQHVLEPLSGYLLLAERLWCDPQQFSGSWNFGPEQRDVRSVGWLVDQLVGLWDGAKGWKQSHDTHPHEATNLSLDISKARHLLRWEPRLGINEGLRLTVEWERERIGGSDMRTVSDIQIQKFLGCAK